MDVVPKNSFSVSAMSLVQFSNPENPHTHFVGYPNNGRNSGTIMKKKKTTTTKKTIAFASALHG